ncbi:hypothetical protein [Nocardia sp. NPDC003963]
MAPNASSSTVSAVVRDNDIRTARLLSQLLVGGRTGPVYLSRRVAPDDGTAVAADIDLVTRRRWMSYRAAERHLAAATGGWDLHELRHPGSPTPGRTAPPEADLMNLPGHEDRRILQRYLKPSKDGTHRRLDDVDAKRGTWTVGVDELTARLGHVSR